MRLEGVGVQRRGETTTDMGGLCEDRFGGTVKGVENESEVYGEMCGAVEAPVKRINDGRKRGTNNHDPYP